jgi:hypothetical protein
MGRRPIPFRIRIALAGLAGLGLAWLIPKGDGAPGPMPTPTATDRPGVTALQVPLDLIPDGVSFHKAGEVRVFLTRSGSTIVGIIGVSTASGTGPLWWCQRNSSFEDEGGAVRYDRDGRILLGTAPRELDRVRVLVTADRVTIFPDDVIRGITPQKALPGDRLPAPCSASERLG